MGGTVTYFAGYKVFASASAAAQTSGAVSSEQTYAVVDSAIALAVSGVAAFALLAF